MEPVFDPSNVAAFAGLALLLTVTPGPDMALVMQVTLSRGVQSAWATTLGICSGLTVHAAAASLGLSILIVRSATLYSVVKIAGAAYLIFLGISALLSAARRPANQDANGSTAEANETREDKRRSSFMMGFGTNVLNPKVAIFYLSILPQFVTPAGSYTIQFFGLAALHAVMGLVWLPLYAGVVDRARHAIGGARATRSLVAASGLALTVFGVKVASDELLDHAG